MNIFGIIKTLKNDLNIDMKIGQIDWTQTIENFKKDDDNGNRHNVFVNKKVLKGKNISTTESLTKEKMRKLNVAKE